MKTPRASLKRLARPAAALFVLLLLNMGLYGRLGAQVSNTAQTTTPAPTDVVAADASVTPEATAANPTQVTLYSSQFTGDIGASGWKAISGDWQFRDGSLVQTQSEGFDLSIVYAQPFQDYQLTATFRHETGNSAGLLFNLPQVDSKNGGQMVRYTDDGAGIFWGYFDTQGIFVGQGFAPAARPLQDAHTVLVQSGASTYNLFLDGVNIAQDIPLTSPQGFIGLTASQSVAAFSNVTVTGLQAAGTIVSTPVANNDLLTNSTAVSGEWVQEAGSVRQTLTETTDYFTGIGILAEQYVVEVDISLPPELADAGGGLLFHAPERDSLKGAYMVRFGEGGKILFWGRYDDAGNFGGQGSVDTPLDANKPHHLTLTVHSASFDINVDGNAAIANIPLEQTSGWIGLISYRGPVIFSNLRLTLGGGKAS